MQVVILAAGRGQRLGPQCNHVPKCLIEVNGMPIIINALNHLTKWGLSRIVVVVGHLGSRVSETLGQRWNGVAVRYVRNTIYHKTNNIHSLWLARGLLDQDTILMECDIYFEQELVPKLFSHPSEDKAVVARMQPFMNGTVVEVTRNKYIKRLIPAEDQNAQFDYSNKYKTVNIYAMTARSLRQVLLPSLEKHIKLSGRNAFYELIMAAPLEQGDLRMRAVFVDDTKWIEIDTPTDLKRAEAVFSK